MKVRNPENRSTQLNLHRSKPVKVNHHRSKPMQLNSRNRLRLWSRMDASLQTRLARRSKNECSIFIADRANKVSHSVYSSLANPTIAVLA